MLVKLDSNAKNKLLGKLNFYFENCRESQFCVVEREKKESKDTSSLSIEENTLKNANFNTGSYFFQERFDGVSFSLLIILTFGSLMPSGPLTIVIDDELKFESRHTKLQV